ncbi:MAG: 1-aminocyclopropane-1-carboxylate deaminase/D-cysteine desulfhydrase, partial [Leadbetterella sp.]
GEELNSSSNATLFRANELGMKLHFVTRNEYQYKDKLVENLDDQCYIISEGGSDPICMQGVADLLDEQEFDFTHIVCPVGSGGTMAGLISAKRGNVKVVGIAVLKGLGYLEQRVEALLGYPIPSTAEIVHDYHFEGYGKYSKELIDFMLTTEKENNLLLDQVYTAKLFYGVQDLVSTGYFPVDSRILVLHTGGVQGRMAV